MRKVPVSPADVKNVVVLVHGIRTHAPWVASIRAEFEKAGIAVEPANYGRLDVFRFLWGSSQKPIEAVWRCVRQAQLKYPNADISFLAHSFGTYIVARLLQREFTFKAHRVVFCGSVVSYDFPFHQISSRFTAPIVNEVSTGDPWPVLAEALSWGYGSAGTFGFRVPFVRDRWHQEFGHSQYLEIKFCRDYWIPFFLSGKLKEADTSKATPSTWIRIFSIFKIKYVGIAILALVTCNELRPYFVKQDPRNPTAQDLTVRGGMGPTPPLALPEGFGVGSGQAKAEQTIVSGESADPGPQPNPDCRIVQHVEHTTFPPKFTKSWQCP